MWRIVVVLAFLLGACVDADGLTIEEPELPGAEVDPVVVAGKLGCSDLTETERTDFFKREVFTCSLDGETHLLFTFNSERSRNLWLHTADTLGYVVVEQGETWTLIEEPT